MVELYTDGATSKNGYADAVGGWAYILYFDGEEKSRGYGQVKGATNQQMELRALIEGCKEARIFTKGRIYVYSDSAYAMNCYAQKWHENWQRNGWKNAKKEPVANKELWEELIPYFEDCDFTFTKVKGHSTNKGNLEVDKLAVMARSL